MFTKEEMELHRDEIHAAPAGFTTAATRKVVKDNVKVFASMAPYQRAHWCRLTEIKVSFTTEILKAISDAAYAVYLAGRK